MTHREEWAGVLPAGKEVTLTGISIARVIDGRSKGGATMTIWGCYNNLVQSHARRGVGSAT